MTSLTVGHKGLTTEIITDGQLATPGSPTPTDVANQSYSEHTLVIYIGGGSSTIPDYTWLVDEDAKVTQIQSPGGGGGAGNLQQDELNWSVAAGTGTVNLTQVPVSPSKVKFLMDDGLTYLGQDKVTLVGQTATIDADDFAVEDGNPVQVEYEV